MEGMNSLNDISLLRTAIKAVHGCASQHLRTARVHESRDGKVIWSGEVEVFTLRDHPETTEAFAWNYRTDDGRMQSVTVLKVPPIDTPADAIRSKMTDGMYQ
jgi:hypothetical protein